jgi:hypothetical protein
MVFSCLYKRLIQCCRICREIPRRRQIQQGVESVDRKNIAMNNRRDAGRGAGTVVLSPSGDVIVDLLPVLAVGNASVLRKSGRILRDVGCATPLPSPPW